MIAVDSVSHSFHLVSEPLIRGKMMCIERTLVKWLYFDLFSSK